MELGFNQGICGLMLNMKFIKFTIIYLLFTIDYLAYLLSKLEPLHVKEIALTFIAIRSTVSWWSKLSRFFKRR